MPVTFLDPGQLTARLDLEAAMPASDGQGGATILYAAVASFWARIEPATHLLTEFASAEGFSVTHRIWLRHRADIAAGMRLRKGMRVFAVRAVHDPDETARYLVCHCEEEGR